MLESAIKLGGIHMQIRVCVCTPLATGYCSFFRLELPDESLMLKMLYDSESVFEVHTKKDTIAMMMVSLRNAERK